MNLMQKIMSKKEILITLGVVVLALASILVGYELGWNPLAGEEPPGENAIPVTNYVASVNATGNYSAQFTTDGLEEGYYTVTVAAGPNGTKGAGYYQTKQVYIGGGSATCEANALVSSECTCGSATVSSGFCCNGGYHIVGEDSSGCSYAQIDGLLNDAETNPIANDNLTMIGVNTQATINFATDELGNFSVKNIPADTYNVSMASGSSYQLEPEPTEIILNSGDSVSYTWQVASASSTGDLNIEVTDVDSGMPIANATVEILGPDGKGDWTPIQATDEAGTTKDSGIEAGSYDVRIQADGYEVFQEAVVVEVGGSASLQAKMQGSKAFNFGDFLKIKEVLAQETEVDCANELDDDMDGLIDCADDDCVGKTGKSGETCEFPENTCDDSADNDGDGKVDCDDDDCSGNVACTGGGGCDTEVTFPDANLEQAVRSAIGIPENPICDTDLSVVDNLDLSNLSITDLSGLEYFTSLKQLNLTNNSINDFNVISGLNELTHLYITGTGISDCGPLSGLTNLILLEASANSINDVSSLANLTKLQSLYLNENQISDVSQFNALTGLDVLNLSSNQISEITGFSSLNQLRELYLTGNSLKSVSELASITTFQNLDLYNNQITDISVLSDLTNPPTTDINLGTNCLDVSEGSGNLTKIETWQANGINVAYDVEQAPGCSGGGGETGTLNGLVLDPEGNVLGDYTSIVVAVGYSDHDYYAYSGILSNDGTFTATDIPYGDYIVRVGEGGTALSYGSNSVSVTVDSAEKTIDPLLLTAVSVGVDSMTDIAVGDALTVSGSTNLLPNESVYITIAKTESVSTNSIGVTVTSSDMGGLAIGDAEVIVEKDGATQGTYNTNSTGEVTLSLESGTYTISARKDGYSTDSIEKEINGNQNIPLDIALDSHPLVVSQDNTNFVSQIIDSENNVSGYWYKVIAQDAESVNLSPAKYEIEARIVNNKTAEEIKSVKTILDVKSEVASIKSKLSFLDKISKLFNQVSSRLARNIGIERAIAGSVFEAFNVSIVDSTTGQPLVGTLVFENTTIGAFRMPIFERVTMGFATGQTLSITASVPGYVSQTETYTVKEGNENEVVFSMISDVVSKPAFLSISPNYDLTTGRARVVSGNTSYDLSGDYDLYIDIHRLKPKLSLVNPPQKYVKPGDSLPVKVEAKADEIVEDIKFKLYDDVEEKYEIRKTEILDEIEKSTDVEKEIDAADVLAEETDGKKTIYVDATANGVNSDPDEMPSFEIIYDSKPPKIKEGKTKPFYLKKDEVVYEEDSIESLTLTQGDVVSLFANLEEDTSLTSDVSGLSSLTYYVDGTEVCSYTTAGGYENLAEIPCEWNTSELHSEVQVVAEDGAGNTYTGDPYTVSVDTSDSSARRRTDVTPPTAVTGVLIVNPEDTDGSKLNLSWDNPEDTDLAGVKIYRGTDFDNVELIVDIDNTSTESYRDNGLTQGVEYVYVFRPYDTSENVYFDTEAYPCIPLGSIIPPNINTEGEESLDTSGSGFEPRKISFTFEKPTGTAMASVRVLKNIDSPTAEAFVTTRPSDISEINGSENRIYKYFEIESNLSEGDIDEILISFSVDKDWMIDNDIASKNISFYHYVYHSPGVWEEIEATQIQEDEEYFYYQGWTSQLGGLYAIGGRPGYVPLTEYLTGSISGKIFIDENADGILDDGELGAQDLVIELYADDGDKNLNFDKDELVLAQQVLGEGNYYFNELNSGNYILYISRDNLPLNYAVTTGNDILWIELFENENLEDINFGYQIVPESDIEKLAEIKSAREMEGEVLVTKKIRREVEPEVKEQTTEQEEKKINVTPAIIWVIVIILVLIFLVWQLTRGVDCCERK